MDLQETPAFDKYEYDSVEGMLDKPPEELEATPDLSTDVYLFTQGGRLVQGNFFRRKIDVNGNPIFRKNKNTIIDTRHYEVQFTDGEVTDITANFIAERMYYQCDKEINYMLLLNPLVDSIKTERVILLQDHQLTVNVKPCIKRSNSG